MADTLTDEVAVFCGIDVGKSHHHAVAVDTSGKRLYDKRLPQDETQLRTLFADLSKHGRVLVVVDQPHSIGALPVAVARAAHVLVAYLPGLSMRRIADLHPGNAKTDAKDAFIIAEAARTLPSSLRRISAHDEHIADLKMLAGFDDDLAIEATRLVNRIRGVLTQVHPALERVLGPLLSKPVGTALLARFGGPAGLSKADRRTLNRVLMRHAPIAHGRIAHELSVALAEQTVVVPGSTAVDDVLRYWAKQLIELVAARAAIEERFKTFLDSVPEGKIIVTIPGVGIRTGAKALIEIGDVTRFPSAGHLAAYAGLAPRTSRSGSSIKGEHRQTAGNTRLKKALFRSAFASIRSPVARDYYSKKRAEGKRHNAALLCLARRQCDVLYAMLISGNPYQPPTENTPPPVNAGPDIPENVLT